METSHPKSVRNSHSLVEAEKAKMLTSKKKREEQ
jgi:hypothetical protein